MNRDIIGIYHGNVAMDTGISAAIFARDLKGQPFKDPRNWGRSQPMGQENPPTAQVLHRDSIELWISLRGWILGATQEQQKTDML